jgi:hypothetical protein
MLIGGTRPSTTAAVVLASSGGRRRWAREPSGPADSFLTR